MTPPIAILGAGPSGLVLARLLELANIDYLVFERDELINAGVAQGGSPDLHEGSGQLALQEAGLYEDFGAKARYDVPTVFADWTGKVHLSFADEEDTTRPEIDRKDLRALLLASVPAHKIQWNRKVKSVAKIDNGLMEVHFVDGTSSAGFRLVVGADGAWSKVRSLLTPVKPQYSGLHYLTTNISPRSPAFESAKALARTGQYLAVGTGKMLALMLLGDGTYYLAAGIRLPDEDWQIKNTEIIRDPAALRELLLCEHFAQWPQVHTDLIRYSDMDFRDWSLYYMPTESLSWTSMPGVTLIGDAAHVSTPFVGEGANCSMFDSVQLAKQISKHGLDHLESAVEEYEKDMFPRAIDLITRSEESGAHLFAEDAPKGWLKTFVGMDIDAEASK
ncbi:hypothetical protein AMS68_006617 [Peltaster fructicola]|uniref:FAD-binding domain-containing protein n=1 Tax=Peltaster fructicola TaxID=286661 RepID=A0A6H0Y382_9PEZI|nr:hypothetical protein AMS68_006617 [Peltaster fructicola]